MIFDHDPANPSDRHELKAGDSFELLVTGPFDAGFFGGMKEPAQLAYPQPLEQVFNFDNLTLSEGLEFDWRVTDSGLTLLIVPEPGRLLLVAGAGLALVALLRRRRRCRATPAPEARSRIRKDLASLRVIQRKTKHGVQAIYLLHQCICSTPIDHSLTGDHGHQAVLEPKFYDYVLQGLERLERIIPHGKCKMLLRSVKLTKFRGDPCSTVSFEDRRAGVWFRRGLDVVTVILDHDEVIRIKT